MDNKEADEGDKLKSRLMSAWHNVRYSWVLKSKTHFSRNSPVFLLGKCYHFKSDDTEDPLASCSAVETESNHVSGNVEAFRRDFASRIWLTYREDFPVLQGSSFTSDCGWGCTLRAGQMMLAQALILHFLGRDWTWAEALRLQTLDTETWTSNAARKLVASLESPVPGERNSHPGARLATWPRGKPGGSIVPPGEAHHRRVVSWFGDIPSAQLGVHKLVEHGRSSGKQAGDWYGPAVVAHILRKAVEEATDPELRGITVYVAQDCTVYSGDVIDSHGEQPLSSTTAGHRDRRAVVILIPIRLGGEKTNAEYFDFVKGILSLEYCLGIVGGKPKQAYYFVGFQDDSLIYMDPHYCQSFVDVSISDFPLETFHCPSPKKMPFNKMDPSCTIGFYSQSVKDYEQISEELSKVLRPSAKEKYPAFTFMKGHGRDYDLSAPPAQERKEWPFLGESRRVGATAGDFVLL
ncbi:cysteine protease ATG4C isoform X2 [Scleropages formosus]|uniref:Cysteine protease n=2 Tax=Scleropages formosus TaxID=113540 RepID=A0A8C9QYE0_SCLFO|nr:cysteine protease ATG4C isoform X2 [Scleropages formosus]